MTFKIFHRGNLASVSAIPVLSHGDIRLRSITRRDATRLEVLLHKDRSWLEPWEATTPGIRSGLDVRWMIKSLIAQTKKGIGLALAIEYQGQLVGQLNVANILYGSVSSATIGYWISKEFAGKSITPTAVALAIDYLFNNLGLHRVEIDIRPDNAASLRVVEKLDMRLEGVKVRFIHIDGAWRDHKIFAITKEEVIGSMLTRLKNTQAQ